MKTVPVSTLKARLSEFLSMVKGGEEVVITEHGTPVARISPLGGAPEVQARLDALIRSGLVRPPSGALSGDFWTLPRPPDRDGAVRRALLEERAEDR